MNSILQTVRRGVGLPEDDNSFDAELLPHINTALMRLMQFGIGPKGGFFVSDDRQTWSEFLGEDINSQGVVTYVCSRVKIVFDPPTNSAALEALKETVKELEWCLISRNECTSY